MTLMLMSVTASLACRIRSLSVFCTCDQRVRVRLVATEPLRFSGLAHPRQGVLPRGTCDKASELDRTGSTRRAWSAYWVAMRCTCIVVCLVSMHLH